MTSDKITKRKPFEMTTLRDVRMTDEERRAVEDISRQAATSVAARAAAATAAAISQIDTSVAARAVAAISQAATSAAALVAALEPIDPAEAMAERHDHAAARVKAALAKGGLQENVRRAAEEFINANDRNRSCRGGDPSFAAATLADAEGRLQYLLAVAKRMSERTLGNKASTLKRQAVANQRRAEIERAVMALPMADRIKAPDALAALRRDGFVFDLSEGETVKVIRQTLRNARTPGR